MNTAMDVVQKSVTTTATASLPKRRERSRPAWDEAPHPVATVLKTMLLTGVVIAILGPLWMVVVTSLSTQKAVNSAGGMVLVPHDLTLAAYRNLMAGGVVTRAIGVSVLITAVGTGIALVVSIMAAYALSKPTMPGHRPLLFLFLLTMFFSAGIIPNYLLIANLGLLNSLWALILPPTVSAFNVVILRSFFMNLDQEILDAARIDGAGEWRILTSQVVPLSKAVIAVVGLFYGVGYWNAFFNAMLYLNDSSKWPLQLVLRTYVLQGQTTDANLTEVVAVAQTSQQMAIVVCALIPIVLVYPFIQRHFRSGVLVGAVKG